MVVDFTNILAFLLIMLRMTGMLMFNPIFGRRNVPVMVNAAVAFLLAAVLVGHVPVPDLPMPAPLPVFLYWVLKEMLVGLMAGFLLNMFFSVLVVGGETIDMQIGISMAKAFDPGTNTSISLTAQYFNILFILVFFLSNGHLTFIQMTAYTFEVLPMGTYIVNFNAFYLVPQLFSNVLLLAVKLALPLVVVEIIVTFAVGIMMRIIPQINVFVVNIQFKLLVGMLLLTILVPTFAAFMENLFIICAENIQAVWLELAAMS